MMSSWSPDPTARQSGRPKVDIAILIDRLYTGDPQLQEQSARALGPVNPIPRAVAPLRDASTSKDAGLRAAAALSLGHASQPGAQSPDLIALLQHDGNSMVREATAQALGSIGSAKAVPALQAAAADDPKGKVRKAAHAALDDRSARRRS